MKGEGPRHSSVDDVARGRLLAESGAGSADSASGPTDRGIANRGTPLVWVEMVIARNLLPRPFHSETSGGERERVGEVLRLHTVGGVEPHVHVERLVGGHRVVHHANGMLSFAIRQITRNLTDSGVVHRRHRRVVV